MSILPFRKRKKRNRDGIDALTARLAKERGFLDIEEGRPAWRFLVLALVLISMAFFATDAFSISISVVFAFGCVAGCFCPALRDFKLKRSF